MSNFTKDLKAVITYDQNKIRQQVVHVSVPEMADFDLALFMMAIMSKSEVKNVLSVVFDNGKTFKFDDKPTTLNGVSLADLRDAIHDLKR